MTFLSGKRSYASKPGELKKGRYGAEEQKGLEAKKSRGKKVRERKRKEKG